MNVNYSRTQVHDQITEVFGEWENGTIKKTFLAKTVKQSLWHCNKKHETGMDKINYCSPFFFSMKISYFVCKEDRTPTAEQHNIFLKSLMDPDV